MWIIWDPPPSWCQYTQNVHRQCWQCFWAAKGRDLHGRHFAPGQSEALDWLSKNTWKGVGGHIVKPQTWGLEGMQGVLYSQMFLGEREGQRERKRFQFFYHIFIFRSWPSKLRSRRFHCTTLGRMRAMWSWHLATTRGIVPERISTLPWQVFKQEC